MAGLSLRTKLLLLNAGIVTGVAALTLVTTAMLAGREVHTAIRKDVRATGSALSQFIEKESADLRQQSLLVADLPVVRSVAQIPDMHMDGFSEQSFFETLDDTASSYKSQMRAQGLRLTDRRGRGPERTSQGLVISRDFSGDRGVRLALKKGAWTGVVTYHGKLMLAATVPIVINGYVKGTLTAYRAIDSGVAVKLKESLGSDIAFVYRGRVTGASLSTPRTLEAPSDISTTIRIFNDRYFALYAPLPNTRPEDKIGFVTLRSYSEAMRPTNRFRTTLTIVFALALLCSLAAGAVASRSLTRPLDGIVEAAVTLSEGKWPERFSVQRTDEIGLLQKVFNEMTENLQASQERLLSLIDSDPLTGIDNHRRFQERLTQESIRCGTSGEALSFILFDLDHFQQYNQRYGHAEGDNALKRIAEKLQEALPEVAIAARYGGEEFAALLPQHTLEEARQVAESVRQTIEQEESQIGSHPLTISAGCAEFGVHSSQGEGLVLAAELAVSRAKQLGRNRVCTFESVPGADDTADPYQLHKYLQDGSLGTIQALAAAVDAKDSYTQGHSTRVAEWSRDLAAYIGLSPHDIELIFTTGTLHDVGKIGVPDHILKKPDRLTDEERAIMETHPVLGELIVKKAPQLAPTLPGVRHHHERWDGRGYPDGLQGEKIPLMARILACADTFDAMTSDRPYRKGMDVSIALSEIEKNSGLQFDPMLGPAFVTMMREKFSLPLAS